MCAFMLPVCVCVYLPLVVVKMTQYALACSQPYSLLTVISPTLYQIIDICLWLVSAHIINAQELFHNTENNRWTFLLL